MKSNVVRQHYLRLFLITILGLTLTSSGYVLANEKPPEHSEERFKLPDALHYPENPENSPTRVQKKLQILKNGNWKEVANLLEKLSPDNEPVKIALIARLKKETKEGNHESGTYGEYYLKLLQRVSNLNDPSIIEPLVESLSSATGVYVPNSLAKFADKSLQVLTEKYQHTQDTDLQNGILFTIERILQQNATKKWLNSHRAAYQSLKALLLKGLNNADPFVREQAIITLITLGDTSVIPNLEILAKNDTYSIRGGEGSDLETGVIIYPLRELAQEAIAKLK